jgi:hypothetical protein
MPGLDSGKPEEVRRLGRTIAALLLVLLPMHESATRMTRGG